jgi:hypothetical protein
MNEFIISLISLASGGVIWEVFKYFYPDIKRYFNSKIEAKNSFYTHLDPLLKASNELYGKLESLSKEDFSTFIKNENSNSIDPEHNKKYVLYLFAQFWAQIEYIRLESQYTSLSKIKSGKELLRIIETIESRKYRILDRSIQRIIGECLITNDKQKFRILTLREFLDEVSNSNSSLAKWIIELDNFLDAVTDKEKRQKVLRFGIIVASLIDHFDPSYSIVRRRTIYVNKLSEKSKKMLKNNLYPHYLSFISGPSRYYTK